MDGWWDELDEEILDILRSGPMDTSRLATKLGMSADAVGSCLAMLSAAGHVRIRSAELRSNPDVCVHAA